MSYAPLTLLALALFDTGLFSAQVANQRRVLDMDPQQPTRFNSVYMVVYFIGGSLGTAVGGPLVSLFGWTVVALVAAAAVVMVAVLYLGQRKSLG